MWYNHLIIWLLKSPLHGMLSQNTMLITYTGRKSGRQYTVPVNYVYMVEDGKDCLLSTSLRSRKWWRNLRTPTRVKLHLCGEIRTAWAEAVVGEQAVREKFEQYLRAYPTHARFFKVQLLEEGAPSAEDLKNIAAERVVVLTRMHGNPQSQV